MSPIAHRWPGPLVQAEWQDDLVAPERTFCRGGGGAGL